MHPDARRLIATRALRGFADGVVSVVLASWLTSVVPPEERAAASSVTNVPRSLAAALTPLLAGIMLEHSSFGWPLICAGIVKAAYDLLLLAHFRLVRPLEERRL
jgi:MFS family permease